MRKLNKKILTKISFIIVLIKFQTLGNYKDQFLKIVSIIKDLLGNKKKNQYKLK